MLLRLPLVLVAAGTAVAFHAAPAATVRRRAPPLHAYNAEQQILTNMIGVEVEKRWGDKAGRCLDCWARYMGGETHEEADEATGAPRRESASYIEGLEATPWHAVPDWLAALQAGHADEIAAELKAQMAGEALERDGTNVWAAAADAGAEDGSECVAVLLPLLRCRLLHPRLLRTTALPLHSTHPLPPSPDTGPSGRP